MHVSRRDDPDHCSVVPEREGDVQKTILTGPSQRVEALLVVTVPSILDKDQGIVEENTFRLRLTNVMLSALFRLLPSSQSKPAIWSRSIIVYVQYIRS
jgi:hypothetical protein